MTLPSYYSDFMRQPWVGVHVILRLGSFCTIFVG